MAGFDWLLLDGEHAPNDVITFIAQLMALKDSPSAPVVRPASNNPVELKRLLDAGFSNYLIPFVESADAARQAVAATRYPPHGVRGESVAQRGNRFGTVAGYFEGVNEQIGAMAQVFAAGQAAGKPIGILAPVEADARRYLAMGASVVAVGSDLGVFRAGTQALRDRFIDAA